MSLTQSTHVIDNGNMNLQEQLNRIQEMMGLNESNSPKDKMNNLIDKVGLSQAIKMVGIEKISKILNIQPIDLARDYFVDKKYSINDFDYIATGSYNFNFIITDIVDGAIDESWVVDVEILDGSVLLITRGNYQTHDLLDSDLREKDYWWEIQGEIDDIISDILNPYKPEDIDLEIFHNLR